MLFFSVFESSRNCNYRITSPGWLGGLPERPSGEKEVQIHFFFVDCRVCFNFAFLFSHVFTFFRFSLSLSLETGVELFLYCTGKSLTKIRTYDLSFSLSLYFAHTVCRRKICTHTHAQQHTHTRARTLREEKWGKFFTGFACAHQRICAFLRGSLTRILASRNACWSAIPLLLLAAGSFSVPSFFFFQIDFRTNRLKVTVALYVLSMNGRRTVEARTPASWNG